MEIKKKYLTVKEAAEFLGVSALTLRNWDKNGKFSAGRHPMSNYRIYKFEELEKLLKEIDSGERRTVRIAKPKPQKPLKAAIKKLKVKVIEED